MTDHPITPPQLKVYRWWEEACKRPPSSFYEKLDYVAAKAAQWGADQELDACCPWLVERKWDRLATQLRAARRPKPKSLAEEGMETLQKLSKDPYPCNYQVPSDWDTIRRALKRLQELEGQADG